MASDLFKLPRLLLMLLAVSSLLSFVEASRPKHTATTTPCTRKSTTLKTTTTKMISTATTTTVVTTTTGATGCPSTIVTGTCTYDIYCNTKYANSGTDQPASSLQACADIARADGRPNFGFNSLSGVCSTYYGRSGDTGPMVAATDYSAGAVQNVACLPPPV